MYKKKNESLESIYSEVIPKKLYFGGFPHSTHLLKWKEKLETWGFPKVILIDLTTSNEKDQFKLFRYYDLYKKDLNMNIDYYNYPINDNSIPNDISRYKQFVEWIKSLFLTSNYPIIIHCKGGHGRSAMVMVTLLCILYNYNIIESINRVTQLHHKRPGLHYKYFDKTCPVSKIQQNFLYSLFSSHNDENSKK